MGEAGGSTPPGAENFIFGEDAESSDSGTVEYTRDELKDAVRNFFEQLDAHEEDMRRRLENEREKIAEEARLREEEQRIILEEANLRALEEGLSEGEERYELMVAKLLLKRTLEFIVEHREVGVAGRIVEGVRSRLL